MKRVFWQEPYYGPGDLPVHVECSCSIEHAINSSKNAAARCNYTYASNEQALEDFLTVNWAEVREVPDAP